MENFGGQPGNKGVSPSSEASEVAETEGDEGEILGLRTEAGCSVGEPEMIMFS